MRYKALARRLDRLKVDVSLPSEDKIVEIQFVSAKDKKVVNTIYVTLAGSGQMQKRP